MKKIVALVLAMVMVLGLATTAFAGALADPDLNVYGGPYSNFDAKLVLADKAEDDDFATYNVVLTAKKAMENVLGDDWKKGETAEYEDVNGADEFVIVDYADADFAVVDGKTVTYLADAEDYEDGWTEKAQKVLLPFANPSKYDCHAYYAAIEIADVFYRYDGVFYKAVDDATFAAAGTAGFVFNVDGVAVLGIPADVGATGTDIVYSGHVYQVDLKPDPKGGMDKVDAVWCNYSGVKETFQFETLKSAAIAKWGQYGWVEVPYVDGNNAGSVYVKWEEPTNWTVIGGTAAGTVDKAETEGETVTSPKTFDAGIAMYVGMSVMAAAGSAVVLKKKD